MSLVRAVCDRVVVLNFGEVLARGTPDEIARDPGRRSKRTSDERL